MDEGGDFLAQVAFRLRDLGCEHGRCPWPVQPACRGSPAVGEPVFDVDIENVPRL